MKHLLILLVTLFEIAKTSAASFQGLGDLSGGSFYSSGTGISADGKIVSGFSRSSLGLEGFIWESGVMQPLGDLPGDGFESYGADISKDGKVVGGYSFSASGIQAFRWENHVMVALPSLPPGGFQCDVRDINGDGSILVGYSYSASGVEAVVWQNGNISRVADISGVPLPNSEAYGVSYDGSVIIGSSSAPGVFQAYRCKNGVLTFLGGLLGPNAQSGGVGVSGDGEVVVGHSANVNGTEAFRWKNGVIESLGDLPGGSHSAVAIAANYDGSVVVGNSGSDTYDSEGFIWDQQHGMRSVKSVLEGLAVSSVAGWVLGGVEDVSADGKVLTGAGIDPSGRVQGWIADLTPDNEPPTINCPSPAVVDCSSSIGATGALNVSVADPDGDVLTVIWTVDSQVVQMSSVPSEQPNESSEVSLNYNFSFGTHSISVSASDGTADPVTCSTTLTVIYHFDGFLSPISGADTTGGSVLDPARAFKLGSTIPFRFKTSCAGAGVSIGVHTLELAKWTSSTTSDPAIDATPTDAATTGNQFRAVDDEWHFNLDTKVARLTKGIWKATAHLADGTAHTVWVELK